MLDQLLFYSMPVQYIPRAATDIVKVEISTRQATLHPEPLNRAVANDTNKFKTLNRTTITTNLTNPKSHHVDFEVLGDPYPLRS